MKVIKKKITYRPYLLKKKMVVNGWEFKEVIIDPHYEEEHGSYMNDEKILTIVQQLDGRSDFVPHRQGKLVDGTEWQSFFWEPFFLKDKTKEKAYRLVWYWEIGKPRLWIINCHRRKKYEK